MANRRRVKPSIGKEENGIHDLEQRVPTPHSQLSLQSDESQTRIDDGIPSGELHRQLRPRHIAMISIGAAIGTGVFIATGGALQRGGPIGLVLAYCLVGLIAWCLMIALGEMIAVLPVEGGHITLAERFVDSSMSFTLGWIYSYTWLVGAAAELSATGVLISQLGKPGQIPTGSVIPVGIVIIGLINLGGVRLYGEVEFWFCLIKVITIIGLIILSIVILSGGTPSGDKIGFRHWGVPFAQFNGIPGPGGRFLGFFDVIITAAFSYIGTEIPAITAAEARNPGRSLPKVVKRVTFRIVLFYILCTIMVSLLVSQNDPNLCSPPTIANERCRSGSNSRPIVLTSPFVIAINNAQIPHLSKVVQVAFITSACSAASSDIYVSSRSLYGLAKQRHAPKILKLKTSWGVPIYPYLIAMTFTLLSFMAAVQGKSSEIFEYFTNMTSICGLLSWCAIFVTYLRFFKGCKVKGEVRSDFPYRAPFQPYASWFGLCACLIIIAFNFLRVLGKLEGSRRIATLVTSYLPVGISFLLYYEHKRRSLCAAVKYRDMDFRTGRRDAADEQPEKEPKNWAERVWRAVM